MFSITAKKLTIIAIALLIAVLHIIGPGRQATGLWYNLYYSYFADVALPFSVYFLLCASEARYQFLRSWWAKASLVFCAAAVAEILQYFGINAFGSTFDPLDFAAYLGGGLLASAIERAIFARFLPFWDQGPES